jgi:hypothetical protein
VKNVLLALLAFTCCTNGFAAAQPPPRIDQAALEADVRERADLMAVQLALTPDQRERALPIIRNSLLRRWSALTSAWADGDLDDQEKVRLRNQFDVERRGVVAMLDGFLSDEQISTFRRLQTEETTRFQNELRQGRYAAPAPPGQ